MELEKERRLHEIFGSHFEGAPAEALEKRLLCQQLIRKINLSSPEEIELRRGSFAALFGKWDKSVHIEPPFYCDFGSNISIGENSYLNFNCTILDTEKVAIGKNCWIAPNVQIYAATHPVEAKRRRKECIAMPINIGNDVWLGGGVIVCPGVTIGDRAVIGAGSIVTKNIPADSVAFGNPCKVHRTLQDNDAE
ncbi:MAG: sugar O-acetyltransferase [Fibrobacteraceae bacterium]|nr:sugar O-acetyltransferase [Fibrobacteraceae bacterium]